MALTVWMKLWSLRTYSGSCSEKCRWFTGWLAFVFGRLKWENCSHSSRGAKDGENDHNWEFFKISHNRFFIFSQNARNSKVGIRPYFLQSASCHCCLPLQYSHYSLLCLMHIRLQTLGAMGLLLMVSPLIFPSWPYTPPFILLCSSDTTTSGPYLETCPLLTSLQYLRKNSCTQLLFSDLKIPINVFLCHQDKHYV